MDPKREANGSLEVEPVKMKRKVSFRDEEKNKPIADVIFVPTYKQLNSEQKDSCLKCEIL